MSPTPYSCSWLFCTDTALNPDPGKHPGSDSECYIHAALATGKFSVPVAAAPAPRPCFKEYSRELSTRNHVYSCASQYITPRVDMLPKFGQLMAPQEQRRGSTPPPDFYDGSLLGSTSHTVAVAGGGTFRTCPPFRYLRSQHIGCSCSLPKGKMVLLRRSWL